MQDHGQGRQQDQRVLLQRGPALEALHCRPIHAKSAQTSRLKRASSQFDGKVHSLSFCDVKYRCVRARP